MLVLSNGTEWNHLNKLIFVLKVYNKQHNEVFSFCYKLSHIENTVL
jgi:hypothetical protein